MNLRMADRAVPIARIGKVMRNLRRRGRVFSGHHADVAVALDAKLSNITTLEQLRVRRAVWIVARCAPFDLCRRMFEDERTLFVRVASVADSVRPCREPCLLQLEASVRIMAIAAIHRAFQHPVVKGPVELGLGLVMTRHAEQHLVFFQHVRW